MVMQKKSVFSVVIASYQSQQEWKAAVQSVLDQNYPNVELIFSDDGSLGFDPQEIEQAIKKRKSVNLVSYRVISRKTNLGTVHNMQSACLSCSGKYLLFMAADDALYDENVLSRFAHSLEKQPENVMGVYARAILCHKDLSPTGCCSFDTEQAIALNALPALDQWRMLSQRCCIHMGATAFIRERFMTFGGFDTSYRLLEDWPFFLRATESGFSFHFEAFDALLYRRGGISGGKAFSHGRMLCFADQLQMYETLLLPRAQLLGRTERFFMYWRYRCDRQDVWNHYRLKSTKKISRLPGWNAERCFFEAVWFMLYWRFPLAAFTAGVVLAYLFKTPAILAAGMLSALGIFLWKFTGKKETAR